MLRRAPTTLTITAEDVAAYEDLRLQAEVSARHGMPHDLNTHLPQNFHSSYRPSPSAPQPSHSHPDSHQHQGYTHAHPTNNWEATSSDDEPRYAEDAYEDSSDEEITGLGGFDGQDESTMDLDDSILGHQAAGRGGGFGRASSPAAARAGNVRAGRGAGRGGSTAAGGDPREQQGGGGLFAAHAQGQGAGAGGRPQAGTGAVAHAMVTPETRPTRSREERIGVAPERRRR